MTALEIVFCGTSPFAVPSLKALAADPAFRIAAVITQPDRPVGRSQELTPPAVKVAAQELQLPVLQPENINTLVSPDGPVGIPLCDFLVVVSYGQLLTEEVLQYPLTAAVNVHASLLPHLRGASPIQSAMLLGDTATGVTVQKMVRELDAGAILGQERVAIGPLETAPELHDRLADLGAALLVRTLKAPLEPREQDPVLVTHCKKLSREDGVVDIDTMTAAEIDRRVRALTPWPGVRVIGKNKEEMKLLHTSLSPAPEALPVECKDGTTLYLVSVQVPGGKPMSGQAWERGAKK